MTVTLPTLSVNERGMIFTFVKISTNVNVTFNTSGTVTINPTTAGTINNIRWYTGGSNNFGTGVTATVAQAQSYVQATGTIGTTGTQLTVGNHTGSLASPVDPFTVYPGSSTALAVTGSLSNPSTGQFGNQVVYQLAVATTASPGATGQNTFTWLYDET